MHTAEYVVASDDAGMRLDKWLSRIAPDLSRSRIQSLIEGGHLTRQDGQLPASSAKVRTGDCFFLTVPAAVPSELVPWALSLDILYEDTDLLVVNKPAGLTVHPAAGHAQDTLVNALLAHCGDQLSGIGGVSRPGIVHRLDKDTSGAMVVAKNDLAHRHLAAQLKDRTLSRIYHAIVYGVPNPGTGTVDGPIARSPVNRKKMAIVPGGKPARTHYRLLDTLADNELAIVECRLESGRTHQIRVHLTHLGHPLVGDPVYGRKRLVKSPYWQTRLAAIDQQLLHATRIAFTHPTTCDTITCDAPYPCVFADILAADAASAQPMDSL